MAGLGGLLELERKLRDELRALRETRLALERLGLLDLEKAVELEREEARIRMMLYELEKEKEKLLGSVDDEWEEDEYWA